MKIIADNRAISHFMEKEGEPVYTILFPSTHNLEKRLQILEDLCKEIKVGIENAKKEASKVANIAKETLEKKEEVKEEK